MKHPDLHSAGKLKRNNNAPDEYEFDKGKPLQHENEQERNRKAEKNKLKPIGDYISEADAKKCLKSQLRGFGKNACLLADREKRITFFKPARTGTGGSRRNGLLFSGGYKEVF
ncbi:MAG: hypothetical protein HKL88_10980 [Bacteroidia bacterium]|nr:hypothetical protein [Bacteroidia bacterium]